METLLLVFGFAVLVAGLLIWRMKVDKDFRDYDGTNEEDFGS